MLQEIIENYKSFGDAVIEELRFAFLESGNNAELTINCYNWRSDKWQTIKILFSNYSTVRYIKQKNTQSQVIFEAFISQKGDEIIFDFFPIFVGHDDLEEDPNSDFLILCKEVKYEVIDFDIAASKQK